mmetsp:Transcript_23807/g.73501  ORF Transcript_23807/g.73501 Transcript_23807/m.73501 type:complete len:131 (-) Transcript_23807:47-439(-)
MVMQPTHGDHEDPEVEKLVNNIPRTALREVILDAMAAGRPPNKAELVEASQAQCLGIPTETLVVGATSTTHESFTAEATLLLEMSRADLCAIVNASIQSGEPPSREAIKDVARQREAEEKDLCCPMCGCC